MPAMSRCFATAAAAIPIDRTASPIVAGAADVPAGARAPDWT